MGPRRQATGLVNRTAFSHPSLLKNSYIRGFLNTFPEQQWDEIVKVPPPLRPSACSLSHSLRATHCQCSVSLTVGGVPLVRLTSTIHEAQLTLIYGIQSLSQHGPFAAITRDSIEHLIRTVTPIPPLYLVPT